MRLFDLIRTVDVTGISGTGAVAEGAQFSDGTVVLRWLDASVSPENRERGVRPTTVIHESIESVEALHGHNGATKVEWVGLDDDNHYETLRTMIVARAINLYESHDLDNSPYRGLQYAVLALRAYERAHILPTGDPE